MTTPDVTEQHLEDWRKEAPLWLRIQWWFLVRVLRRCVACGCKVLKTDDRRDPRLEPGRIERFHSQIETGENLCESCEEYPEG